MNKSENKEKRCLFCGKRLIDEKIPICLRCKLAGRDTAGKVTEIVGGIALVAGGGKALMDNNKKQ